MAFPLMIFFSSLKEKEKENKNPWDL